jgi:regulatory protein
MDNDLKKALGMALGYLSRRSRSILEMKDYLSKKNFPPLLISRVIQQLCSENYLDDKIFAENYLENRKRNKPKSLFAFRYELEKKGIDPAIMDELLIHYDDLELALLALKPKVRLWRHLDQALLKKKVFGYLRYRGFGFSIIQSAWEQIFNSTANSGLSKY